MEYVIRVKHDGPAGIVIIDEVPDGRNAKRIAGETVGDPTDDVYICKGYDKYGNPEDIISKKHGYGPWSE